MNKGSILLRFLMCLPGAAALLYTFSYPDTILPPNPFYEEQAGLHLYSFKPFMWVLPVLFLELVNCCGPRRNLVWFGALFTVLALALAAYPVLQAHWPEYVEPTFTYQGGMLTTGLLRYASFLAASFAFRMLLLNYMFPPADFQEHMEVGYVSANTLAQSESRTVKDIRAEKKIQRHRFQFKQEDTRLALRWRLVMRRLFLRSLAANIGICSAICCLALWFFLYPQPTEDESLQRDKARMFEHRVNAQGIPLGTTAAVHAAARVMKHISDYESLGGMTRREAEQWLGLDAVPAGYRAWLRDERDIEMPSANSLYENRTRFLTVTNGRYLCVLYIRTNEADQSIVVAELQDAGWDAVADENRRKLGTDWGALYR